MKSIYSFIFMALLISCKQQAENNQETQTIQEETVTGSPFPESLQRVLQAHGGFQTWNEQQTLAFTLPGEEGGETHTTDLHSRKDRIEGPGYSLGYDGTKVWLYNPAEAYEGNAIFYHNLMFYFYAMPFVLADDGILYEAAEPLEFEGTTYPGIRVSYQSGVGASPDDVYLLYYHPDDHTMAWLGYTVTYFSGEPSDDLHWIRYGSWQRKNGLLVPESLTWYEYEAGRPTTPRNTVTFEEVLLSAVARPEAFYQPPQGAETVTE